MKLSKNTITELVKIVVTAAISVLSTLGILSCTVNTGNHGSDTLTPNNNNPITVEELI